MAALVNSVDIEAPGEVVFDYAVDLSNELEWGTPVRIVKLTDGPVQVGSRFDAEWKNGGPIEVDYVAADRPRRWATLGRGQRMDVNLSADVQDLGPTRSRLTVTMELLPHGWLRALLPVLKLAMQKTDERNLAALKGRATPTAA